MVDYSVFLDWVKERFGEENITYAKHGDEICVPTPFDESTRSDNRYLWMNPSGGKSEHPENGCYRCWWTNRSGSLVTLVSQLERIPWDEAQEMLCEQVPLRELEIRVHNFFGSKPETTAKPQTNKGKIHLPPYSYEIEKMDRDDTFYLRAMVYLQKRKIPADGLYVCISGRCQNRIVLPYYDRDGDLIWWNARTMSDDTRIPKYIKPDSDEEIQQENVLYLKEWPKRFSRLLVMEGEFDAISVNLCGLFAAACGGKSLSPSQIEALRDYTPILAFDADEAGRTALLSIGQELLLKGFKEVYFVRPPKVYKDWNKFLQETDTTTVTAYIHRRLKVFNVWTTNQLAMSEL